MAAAPASKISHKCRNRAKAGKADRVTNPYRTNRKRITTRKLRQSTQTELGRFWTDEELAPAAPAWGDYMSEYTPHCRLLYQNVNGLDYKNDFCDGHLLGEAIKENNVDILGMVETKVDWTKEKTTAPLKTNLRKHLLQVQLSTSSSDVTFDTPFQPGGTATLVRGEWSGRTRAHCDPSGMGRWSEVEIMGKDNTSVRIITAYRVCTNSQKTPGTMSARYQQSEVMKNQGIKNPEPRAKVLEDLGARINELKATGEEIIIMMDANDTMQKANSELTKWVERLDLVDPHVLKHGTEEEPATHERGSERIDYIFMTDKISEFLVAAGILEFHNFWKSDHRALYIDLDLEAFLGGRPSPLEMNANRGLMSNDPRAVKIYRESLLRNLEECGLEEKFEKLIDDVEANGGTLDAALAERADDLDELFTRIKLDSEKECKRVKSAPWSPKLRIARHMVTYWKLWMSQHKLKRDYSVRREKIEGDLAAINVKVKFRNQTWKQVQTNLRAAQRNLRRVVKNARGLRRDHLKYQAAAAAESGKTTEAAAIRQIERAENQKESYKRLRRIMGKAAKGGLTHILIEQPDGSTECITDKQEMYNRIVERNKAHFGQADGTPFTVSPLTDILGRYGTTQEAEWLLDGKIRLDRVSEKLDDKLEAKEAVISVLRQLGKGGCRDGFHDFVTVKDYREGHRRWRESTSTSPSGLHLGHEKRFSKWKTIMTKKKANCRHESSP
jgi:hypothetical protein